MPGKVPIMLFCPRGENSARERGTALIEFALILPFLLVITLTVVDLSRAFWIKSVAATAARQGARTAAVVTSSDADTIRSQVRRVLNLANIETADIGTITITPANGQIEVEVPVHFNWLYLGLLNLFGSTFTNPQTITARAVFRREG